MLIAGLPLQNLHAVAMPLCNNDKATTAAHAHSAPDGVPGIETAAADHDHGDHQHAAADINAACDGCSVCQACSAPAVASVAIDVLLDPVETPPLGFATHPSLFVPEQLQRPPSQFVA